MKLKLLPVLFTAAMLALSLSACAGSGTQQSSTESSSEETALSSSDNTSANGETLESYFEANQAAYDELLGGIAEGASATDGIDAFVEVDGNDIVIVVDLTEMYQKAGATSAEDAREALESAGTSTADAQKSALQGAMQRIKDETGVEGIRFVYRYYYDYEQVYELVIDEEGNATGSTESSQEDNSHIATLLEGSEDFMDMSLGLANDLSKLDDKQADVAQTKKDILEQTADEMDYVKSIDTSDLSEADKAYYDESLARIQEKYDQIKELLS